MNGRTRKRCQADDSRLLLDAYPQDVADGVSLLSLPATLNGQTVLPEFCYRASGLAPDVSTLAPTTYGDTLTLAGSGADPTLARGPFLSGDNAIGTTAGKYYQAPNTTLGNVGTDDMIIEVIGYFKPQAANKFVVRKRITSGWYIVDTTGNTIIFYINDGVAAVSINVVNAVTGRYHIIFVADRNYATGLYVVANGVKSSTSNPTGAQLSLDVATPLLVGEHDGSIDQVIMWHAPAWLRGDATGDAEILAWAKARYLTLLGAIPRGRLYSHVTHTRTTAALAEVDGRIYTVGANWPRAGRREGHVGFMPGKPVVGSRNTFPYSEDFVGQWTKGTAGDVAQLSATAGLIDGRPWTELICTNANTADHYLSYSTTPAIAYEHTLWFFVKKGGPRWVWLGADPLGDGAASIWAWFDLENGVIGSKSAAATAIEHGIRPMKDYSGAVIGYQIWFIYSGAALLHAHQIGVSDADASLTYSGGDGVAVDLYLCHAQHEYEAGAPSDAWTTTGSAGSPGADALYIDVSGLLPGTTGRIESRHLALPVTTPKAAGTVASLNKAGSAADSVQHCSANLTTQQPETILTATGGTARTVSPAVDIYDDNGVVIARSTWKPGRAAAEATGVGAIITTPVAADIPTGLDRLVIGGHPSGSRQAGGMVGSVKLFNK